MPTCTNYFGKLFAHLAGALALSAVSAESLDLYPAALERQSVLTQVIVSLVAIFGSMYGIYATRPGGIPKYAFFALFALLLGQTLKPLVQRLQGKGELTKILVMTTGVFVGMMALGFYDNQNMLGFGPYLLAGLVGLIIARILLALFGTEKEKAQGGEMLRLFGVALFAVFTAYDVQILKAGAKSCKRARNAGFPPDYPRESLGLYLDFINLFSSLGGRSD